MCCCCSSDLCWPGFLCPQHRRSSLKACSSVCWRAGNNTDESLKVSGRKSDDGSAKTVDWYFGARYSSVSSFQPIQIHKYPRARSTYMTASAPQRAAEPYQSHGDLVSPDHVLLLMCLCTDHVRQSGSRLIISTSSQLYPTRVCGTNSESSSQLHICVCCNRLTPKITLSSSMSNRCCVAAPVRFISGGRGQTSAFRRVKRVMSVCWCVSEEQKELKKTR